MTTNRIALIGCGAVAREWHLPVLAGMERVRIAALVDRDVARAGDLATLYRVEHVLDDHRKLDSSFVDAAIVATPPAHHARACLDLIAKKIPVLIEKPFALTSAEATSMVEAAKTAGVALASGYHRRYYPSLQLLKELIERREFGPVLGFDVEEGGPYAWPLASLGILMKDQSGGGVFMDAGCHSIDQLLYLFPTKAEVVAFQDNSLGGIETDCELRLRLEGLEGTLRFSRTHTLKNRLRIECEKAAIELRSGQFHALDVIPRGEPLSSGRYRMQAGWEDAPVTPGYGIYRRQMDAFLDTIEGRPSLLSTGETALAAVRLVEECYAKRVDRIEPWVSEGTQEHRHNRPARIFVTGATGFIGCRFVEIAHLRDKTDVRALVHNPTSAARLARLPVEMVQGDLSNPSLLAEQMKGCDAVVHCAVAPSWFSRGEMHAINVTGTKNLLDAARRAGVPRFVHLSTTALYGGSEELAIDESTPLAPPSNGYEQTKIAAERAVIDASKGGWCTVVLRPAHVFGPFGKTFVTNPIRHLAQGTLILPDGERIPSNTIYVDNVAEAMCLALAAPASNVNGEIFNLSCDDRMTWAEFYGYFAREMGVPVKAGSQADRARDVPRSMGFLRSYWRALWAVPRSPEFRALGRSIYYSDPLGRLPRWLFTKMPSLRRRLGIDTPTIYRPTPAKASGELVMSSFPGVVSIEKAKRVLGYRPIVDRERAMQLTLLWLRESRLI